VRDPEAGRTLVIGGTGKTGRRVVERLTTHDVAIRAVSRSTQPRFDWEEPSTWERVLEGVDRAYITYAPDIALPGAVERVREFADLAVQKGVGRLVLLTGRGEEEAQRAEKVIQRPTVEWTVVRASWFCQNFSEGPFRDMVLNGEIALPAGEVREPFVDVDDIADVVAASLTEEGHSEEIYEVTGPRLLTFADAAVEIGRASGRPVRYRQISMEEFKEGLTQGGVPEEMIWLLEYLFTTVLDGRNAETADGVRRALGREPRDFAEWASAAAGAGAWSEE